MLNIEHLVTPTLALIPLTKLMASWLAFALCEKNDNKDNVTNHFQSLVQSLVFHGFQTSACSKSWLVRLPNFVHHQKKHAHRHLFLDFRSKYVKQRGVQNQLQSIRIPSYAYTDVRTCYVSTYVRNKKSQQVTYAAYTHDQSIRRPVQSPFLKYFDVRR